MTGTIAPADIAAISTQGLAAGNMAAIVKEIQAGYTYANVHTNPSPAGEIRGQLEQQGERFLVDDDQAQAPTR